MKRIPTILFKTGDDESAFRQRLSEYDSNPDKKIKGIFTKYVCSGEALYEGESLCDAIFSSQEEPSPFRITANSTGGLTMLFDNGNIVEVRAFSNRKMYPCYLLEIGEEEWSRILQGDSDN